DQRDGRQVTSARHRPAEDAEVSTTEQIENAIVTRDDLLWRVCEIRGVDGLARSAWKHGGQGSLHLEHSARVSPVERVDEIAGDKDAQRAPGKVVVARLQKRI